ncbi:MAG: HD domain-containing protein [Candidatus Omnitrophica bacterium]|nr:HD domain-containing protein [Candidatus Omnitrophota bacterium]
MSDQEKFISQSETPKTPEAEPRERHMAYGSERFESATSNNHNEILFTDTRKITKVVLGKDVALVLPKNPDEIPKWAGYPTHQESWLPLWFVLLNHAQHRTPEESAYRQKLNERLMPEDRELMRKALIFKANEFWQTYKQDTETKEPRKRYKNITRIVQDILLYVDAPEAVIENQEEYLTNYRLFPFIQRANELRKGISLEQAGNLEVQVEQILNDYTNQVGKEESKKAYEELQEKLLQNSTDELVVLVPDKNIADADLYANLASYDLLMSEDEHDQDVVSIIPTLNEPQFHQLDTKFGPKLAHERRMDVIAVPENLGTWDVVRGGKESYQPISMILMTHTKPETGAGTQMQERLQKELTPEFVAHHYLGAAEEFLHRDAWSKSFAKRYEGEGVKQIKKVIPLYRVACDLLPRAVYMLKTSKFPAGVENNDLWEVGEVKEEAEKIQELFKRQDATQEELNELAKAIEIKFQKWFADEDYLLFLENMERMGQLGTLTEGKQLQELVRLTGKITDLVPNEQRDKVRAAIAMAVSRHKEQHREGGEKYVNHVLRVGTRAAQYTKAQELENPEILIKAATLHDILEDTSTSEEEMGQKFGKEILGIVKAVSHRDEDEPDEEYLNRVAAGGNSAVLVKRFDRLENLNDLAKAPKEFRLRKLRELEQAIPIWQRIDPEGAVEIEKITREMLSKEI